jgi:hypothetical protein
MTTASHDLDPDQGQPVDPATGQLSPTVRRELRRQLREDELAEAAEARQAAAHGGPCTDCGCTLSWLAPGVGGWHANRCHLCWQARGGDAGAGDDDGPARVKACELILGDIAPPEWANRVPGVPTVAGRWEPEYKARAFRWFSETPGATPAPDATRFAYTSAEQLRERLYAGRQPPPPQLHDRGRKVRCEGCGRKGKLWTCTQRGVPAPTDSRGQVKSNRAYFEVTWTCHHCRHTDVEQRPTQVRGVSVQMLTG